MSHSSGEPGFRKVLTLCSWKPSGSFFWASTSSGTSIAGTKQLSEIPSESSRIPPLSPSSKAWVTLRSTVPVSRSRMSRHGTIPPARR